MKRIFLLSSYPLFGRGVEHLLSHEEGLEILGCETDVERALDRIAELKPDVVIVDHSDPEADPTSAVVRILRLGAGVKVVGLNLDNNTLWVRSEERHLVREVGDLVRAIEGNPLSYD